jgi:hypothetical protein
VPAGTAVAVGNSGEGALSCCVKDDSAA